MARHYDAANVRSWVRENEELASLDSDLPVARHGIQAVLLPAPCQARDGPTKCHHGFVFITERRERNRERARELNHIQHDRPEIIELPKRRFSSKKKKK